MWILELWRKINFLYLMMRQPFKNWSHERLLILIWLINYVGVPAELDSQVVDLFEYGSNYTAGGLLSVSHEGLAVRLDPLFGLVDHLHLTMPMPYHSFIPSFFLILCVQILCFNAREWAPCGPLRFIWIILFALFKLAKSDFVYKDFS